MTYSFTDIVGSTILWEQYPKVMVERLPTHDVVTTEGARNAVGGTSPSYIPTEVVSTAFEFDREPWIG